MSTGDVEKGRSPTPSHNHIDIEQCCKGAGERAALLHGFDPKEESKHEEEYVKLSPAPEKLRARMMDTETSISLSFLDTGTSVGLLAIHTQLLEAGLLVLSTKKAVPSRKRARDNGGEGECGNGEMTYPSLCGMVARSLSCGVGHVGRGG